MQCFLSLNIEAAAAAAFFNNILARDSGVDSGWFAMLWTASVRYWGT